MFGILEYNLSMWKMDNKEVVRFEGGNRWQPKQCVSLTKKLQVFEIWQKKTTRQLTLWKLKWHILLGMWHWGVILEENVDVNWHSFFCLWKRHMTLWIWSWTSNEIHQYTLNPSKRWTLGEEIPFQHYGDDGERILLAFLLGHWQHCMWVNFTLNGNWTWTVVV